MKALRLSIYKDNSGDCSNHGISSKFRDILLVCDEGYIDVNGDEENLCRIDTIMGHKFVRPIAEPKGAGWMSGGTMVYTCDSRFRRMSEYPLCLHDRQETWEQYEAMSH